VTVRATRQVSPPTPESPAPKVEQLVPERYADSKTSGLKCTVKDGENQQDFPLTK
jgi:hypothetical protein